MKFVALRVPEIIGGTLKIGQSLDTTINLPFCAKFLMSFWMDPAYGNVLARFEVYM